MSCDCNLCLFLLSISHTARKQRLLENMGLIPCTIIRHPLVQLRNLHCSSSSCERSDRCTFVREFVLVCLSPPDESKLTRNYDVSHIKYQMQTSHPTGQLPRPSTFCCQGWDLTFPNPMDNNWNRFCSSLSRQSLVAVTSLFVFV